LAAKLLAKMTPVNLKDPRKGAPWLYGIYAFDGLKRVGRIL